MKIISALFALLISITSFAQEFMDHKKLYQALKIDEKDVTYG